MIDAAEADALHLESRRPHLSGAYSWGTGECWISRPRRSLQRSSTRSSRSCSSSSASSAIRISRLARATRTSSSPRSLRSRACLPPRSSSSSRRSFRAASCAPHHGDSADALASALADLLPGLLGLLLPACAICRGAEREGEGDSPWRPRCRYEQRVYHGRRANASLSQGLKLLDSSHAAGAHHRCHLRGPGGGMDHRGRAPVSAHAAQNARVKRSGTRRPVRLGSFSACALAPSSPPRPGFRPRRDFGCRPESPRERSRP